MELKAIHTRFRAYQLGEPGSSFSYFADNHFTLIEAKLTARSIESLAEEMRICAKTEIDTLHITSWDMDHCNLRELKEILATLMPKRIEYPGYDHDSENAKNCLAEIIGYQNSRRKSALRMLAQRIDPPYIEGLNKSDEIGYSDLVFHPKQIFPKSNDNSTVKVFRGGMFNVASLGDIEHANIGSMLRRSRAFKNEIDVLILAHHGSNNAVNSKNFFQAVKPSLVICSSDYDNQYGHPHDDVKEALHELQTRIFTTKTGDVVIESIPNHRKEYSVKNYISNSDKLSSRDQYISKKFRLLNMNSDTLRARQNPGFKGLK